MRVPCIRKADTYRAAIRNAIRAQGRLREWRVSLHFWSRANIKARLEERAHVCQQAREFVARVVAGSLTTPPGDPILALRRFWSGQKRTRVVNRILRTLTIRGTAWNTA